MQSNGLENYFIMKNNKKMQYGYTTGSCAAAAAKAATIMLFTGQVIRQVDLLTPKGILLHLEVHEVEMDDQFVRCSVKKMAGDDPDVTDGVLVYAQVSKCSVTHAKKLADQFIHEKIYDSDLSTVQKADETEPCGGMEGAIVGIDGGFGVGRITKPGLEQPIKAPAINRVPRRMIMEEVREICDQNEYFDGIEVIISVPQGVEKAVKTFNPRLGIEGGISILGTSGIVEPMSEAALIASIEVELKMRVAQGDTYLVIAPGNYGTRYLGEHFPFDLEAAVKCSNFVGDTIDMAQNLGVKGILFVAHMGKFVKVSGGIMNTHSRNADCRMELLAAHGLKAGLDPAIAVRMLDCVTTDDALKLVDGPMREKMMADMMEKISYYLNHRAYDEMEIGAIVFSNVYGELGRTANAQDLINKILEEQKR